MKKRAKGVRKTTKKAVKRKPPTAKRKPPSALKSSSHRVRQEGRPNFDWSNLSKGSANKDFEDMCLDLFASEYGDVNFVPGPRRSGKDGGADATYDGQVGGQAARWKVACAIRNDLRTLSKKLVAERDGAVKGSFTGLIVMTSLDITAVQVSALRDLAKSQIGKKGFPKKLKRAHVWGRANLERLLIKHPWVAATYFGHPLLPSFVPLSPAQRDVAEQPDLELVGRTKDLEAAQAFLGSDDQVLVVQGAGVQVRAGSFELFSKLPRAAGLGVHRGCAAPASARSTRASATACRSTKQSSLHWTMLGELWTRCGQWSQPRLSGPTPCVRRWCSPYVPSTSM